MTHVIHIYPNLGGFVWFCHTYIQVVPNFTDERTKED